MKTTFILLVLSFTAVSCVGKKINESKEITRNTELMQDLNKGDNDSLIAKISEDTKDDNEKIILASALAQSAGIDVYSLIPLLKEKVFNGPLANQNKNKDQKKLVKKLVKKSDQKVTIKISNKDIDQTLHLLKDLQDEVIEMDDEFFSRKDIIRIKASLIVLEPDFDNLSIDTREEALNLIEKTIKEIEDKIALNREGQEDQKFIVLDLEIGQLRKDMVKFMVSTLELIPIVSLTPEVHQDNYYKIDKAIKILERVDTDASPAILKRAHSYVVFLSAAMVINNARTMLDINDDYDKLLCTLDERKIIKFIGKTENYFLSLNKAASKLAESDAESTFVKIADSSAKLLVMEKQLREISVKALMKVIEIEKKRICE